MIRYMIKKLIREIFNSIKNRGLLGTLVFLLFKIVRGIKCILFGFPKLHNRESHSRGANQEIYEKWKKKWIDKSEFYDLFVESYDYHVKKIRYNQKCNFRFKKIFVILCIILFLALIVLSVWLSVHVNVAGKEAGNETENALSSITTVGSSIIVNYGVFLVPVMLIIRSVAKWGDIKKYQETWIRHSQSKFKLDEEMLAFLQKLKPYDSSEYKTNELTFKKRVIEIWRANQDKFVHNMEQKEKTLVDIFNKVKE